MGLGLLLDIGHGLLECAKVGHDVLEDQVRILGGVSSGVSKVLVSVDTFGRGLLVHGGGTKGKADFCRSCNVMNRARSDKVNKGMVTRTRYAFITRWGTMAMGT